MLLLPPSPNASRREDTIMGDLIYVGLTGLFFALSWNFVRMADRLGGER